MLESIAEIDGSVVLDRDSRLVAFGTILKRRVPLESEDEEIGEGARMSAAIGVSEILNLLMVSEGGQVSIYQKGHRIWTV